MATKSARDSSDPKRILSGFCMFYRLLTAQVLLDCPPDAITDMLTALNPLPRTTVQTRAAIVAAIDENGVAIFVNNAILELENTNPELLQMAHYFELAQANYWATMQGFALLYTALLFQSGADRRLVHRASRRSGSYRIAP
jgi:hypothetical protein